MGERKEEGGGGEKKGKVGRIEVLVCKKEELN